MRAIEFAVAGMVLLGLSLPASGHGPPGREAGPAALAAAVQPAAATVEAFHAALRRGDAASAAALLADDALIFEEGGVERSKAEYVSRHLPADAASSQVVASTVVRRVGGSAGRFAWIASEGRTTGTWKGRPVDRATTETMLLRRARTGWKIVHIHWSSGSAP
ncbi:MAG TPA: nuclear transport factor 2 family protein [Sphingomicrobium sp.]